MDDEDRTGSGSYRAERLRKLEELRRLEIDPYPAGVGRTHLATDLREHFEDHRDTTVTLAGRLMARRGHKTVLFLDLQDKSGTFQIIVDKGIVGGTDPRTGSLGFDDTERLLDRGDLIEATGTVELSRRGEPSVMASRVRMLAKSVRPLPDAWQGINDPEALVRTRYLQSIIEPGTRRRFEAVSEILFGIRHFLHQRGYLEFQTPVLQPLYGGGKARPFTTKVWALDNADYYLAISHELYLKRLVVAGFEDVFTIGRYFRNEGIDKTHNPEFSMLETMSAFHGYEYNMDLTEALYKYLATDVMEKRVVEVKGQQVDLTSEWRRASMVELVKEACDVDFSDVTDLDEAERILTRHGVSSQPTVGHALVELFEEVVAPTLIAPTIVHGHPVEISPLAKATADPRYVERFELYIGGTEQGDNWTELNDPIELERRLRREGTSGNAAVDAEAHPLDMEFIEAMEYGMPPTTGLGPGIERLAMLLTEAERISEVMYFPLIKPRWPGA